jgi:hypothetical protein
VTQQFNTTTSMGRLTLNMLLSFAQFEREVTSERIRDKIAASKRKGLWVGGMVPLGYELKDGKLLIIEEEAERVRTIFRRYLELGSVNRLVVDLRHSNLRSKVRKLSNGETRGGAVFSQGSLFYLLRNRFYVGEVRYKGEICPGPQPPLMDHALFEAVQTKLTEQRSHHAVTPAQSNYLLSGLLFDDAGYPMAPSHATKRRIRYRYYVSRPVLRGPAKLPAGSISRVPAPDIESAVIKGLKAHLGDSVNQHSTEREFMTTNVARIEVHNNQLVIRLKSADADDAIDRDADNETPEPRRNESDSALLIPWRKPPAKRFREILLPPSIPRHEIRLIKAERRAALIRSIARGRDWLDQIVSGAVPGVEQIAARHKCSLRHVNMTISMAFIAPALVKAAVEGRLPRGIGVAALRDAPAEWSHQFQRLGLAQTL